MNDTRDPYRRCRADECTHDLSPAALVTDLLTSDAPPHPDDPVPPRVVVVAGVSLPAGDR